MLHCCTCWTCVLVFKVHSIKITKRQQQRLPLFPVLHQDLRVTRAIFSAATSREDGWMWYHGWLTSETSASSKKDLYETAADACLLQEQRRSSLSLLHLQYWKVRPSKVMQPGKNCSLASGVVTRLCVCVCVCVFCSYFLLSLCILRWCKCLHSFD